MYFVSFVGTYRFSASELYLYVCLVGLFVLGDRPVVRSASTQDNTNSERKETYIHVSRGLEFNVSVSET
jgi:hypothetical protein